MQDVYHFADDGKDVDGLPTEGVEITSFNMVTWSSSITQTNEQLIVFFCSHFSPFCQISRAAKGPCSCALPDIFKFL